MSTPLPVIDHFVYQHAFLSNFAPCNVTLDGLTFPTIEHAYQAAKSLDPEVREYIQKAATPALAKFLGNRLRDLRPGWDELRVEIMAQLVEQKFRQAPHRQWLLATQGRELIEGNYWHDNYWGDCRCQDHVRHRECATVGENNLGHILMAVRELVS